MFIHAYFHIMIFLKLLLHPNSENMKMKALTFGGRVSAKITNSESF